MKWFSGDKENCVHPAFLKREYAATDVPLVSSTSVPSLQHYSVSTLELKSGVVFCGSRLGTLVRYAREPQPESAVNGFRLLSLIAQG